MLVTELRRGRNYQHSTYSTVCVTMERGIGTTSRGVHLTDNIVAKLGSQDGGIGIRFMR